MRPSLAVNALVAVLVGFGGTLALIVAAAQAVGANQAQTASGVAALCLAMAGISAFLSVRHRIPIIAAWSTPGAALIAGTDGSIGLAAAIGAYLAAGALILLTGFVGPLARAIERLPTPVAAAMLAGVLIRFTIGVFEHLGADPLLVAPMVAAFLLLRLASPAWAVIAVIGLGIALVYGLDRAAPIAGGFQLSHLTLIAPAFDPAALLGLALPLYLVTMASQNLPGFAVLKGAGYQPPAGSILRTSGLASVLIAPLGGLTVNLAAITAAICTGPDTHPDPAQRWKTGPWYALFYLILAMFGASLVALFAALPPAFIATVAGLALLAPLIGALTASLKEEAHRPAAVLTLCVTASGLSLFGIGSAFWGLATGLAVMGLERAWARLKA
ncbi:MAG: benzoate/H(+) symporter BenE family transporter [Alphaproteobacteria bacterium]|nr:benzoate/H(+) symporter BenE family transporter [Alphaproteobacteria bacterium]